VKSYRPYAPHQSYLLPPSPSDWLPEGHLVYFILDLVEGLDLGEIERPMQAKDSRGERSYSPRMMTALLLYGYATGVFSARRIARATVEDVAFRVLAGGEHPHFTTVNEFRAVHRAALGNLFGQVLRECQSAGLVKLGHVAIDGTKMKANASKHKAMSYDRLKKSEARIAAEVEALLARAEAVDAAEDELYGVGQEPQDLPAELQRREGRLAKIREVRAALEKEAAQARAATLRDQAAALRAKAEQPSHSPGDRARAATLAAKRDRQASLFDDDDPPSPSPNDDLPLGKRPTNAAGQPTSKAQRNFTDPESRIMVRDGGFIQAFNAQIAVDDQNQVIVAAALSNNAADAGYFAPMLWRAVDNCDAVPEHVSADAGYFSAENIRVAEGLGSEPFVSVGKHRHDGSPTVSPPQPHWHTEPRQRMRALLESPRGRAVYARRKAIVEPVFGQIRCCQGFQKLSFRGLLKSRCEWLFVCLTHNLLKLFRARRASAQLAATTA
jgi:transposase/IS5 family transposase